MTEINYSKLRPLTSRELINALGREGFHPRIRSGAHHQYRHPDGRRERIEIPIFLAPPLY